MNAKIKVILENLPDKPGCYQMLDSKHNVLYVGKAKNLKVRVSQYFNRAQNNRITRMVNQINDIQIIITKTEKEALLLELNLIHKFLPPFNVLLKDDKQYPYIAIKEDQYPYIVLKRNDKQKGYTYFGPYTSSKAAWETINLLNRLFPLKKCKRLPKRACIYYHLGQCLAPCINQISTITFINMRNEISDFLLGDNQKYIDSLEEQATNALLQKNTPLALDLLEMVESIKHINQAQNVQNSDHVSRDVINYASLNDVVSITILNVREGKLLGKQKINFILTSPDLEEEIVSLIMQYYQNHTPPKRILIPVNHDNQVLLEETLDVSVSTHAHNSMTKNLLTMAKDNAQQDLTDYLNKADVQYDVLGLLEELQELLALPSIPLHIDLFDNSHMQGKAAVGAAISYVNGEPYKPLYRHYNLKYQANDFENMMDIVLRRIERYKKEKGNFPDLIIVDGGIIQVNAAMIALDTLDINIKVVGLFKNEKHQTESLIDSDGEVYTLDKHQKLLFLLTRMQDEVHRYAIKGHHNKKQRTDIIGILTGVVGLGPKRERELMSHFKTIKALKEASVDEISKIVPLNVAKNVKERLALSIENQEN